MGEIGLPGTAAMPPALAPPPVSTTNQPRTVEPSSGGSLETQEQSLSFNSGSAVLLLVERSARNFKEVVELLDDVHAAAAMTGVTVEPSVHEEHVDEYA